MWLQAVLFRGMLVFQLAFNNNVAILILGVFLWSTERAICRTMLLCVVFPLNVIFCGVIVRKLKKGTQPPSKQQWSLKHSSGEQHWFHRINLGSWKPDVCTEFPFIGYCWLRNFKSLPTALAFSAVTNNFILPISLSSISLQERW